jgi:hypothetical protein
LLWQAGGHIADESDLSHYDILAIVSVAQVRGHLYPLFVRQSNSLESDPFDHEHRLHIYDTAPFSSSERGSP